MHNNWKEQTLFWGGVVSTFFLTALFMICFFYYRRHVLLEERNCLQAEPSVLIPLFLKNLMHETLLSSHDSASCRAENAFMTSDGKRFCLAGRVVISHAYGCIETEACSYDRATGDVIFDQPIKTVVTLPEQQQGQL